MLGNFTCVRGILRSIVHKCWTISRVYAVSHVPLSANVGSFLMCVQYPPWIWARNVNMGKKREYGQRIREIEHGVFTPLVLSTTGGMGREATTFYRRLADMTALKRQQPYSTVMRWLRCRLSFASLRASIMCIRGSRSSLHRPVFGSDIALASCEGRVPPI